MTFRLAPTAAAEGYRLEAHDVVGSTNALALDHARAGDAGRLWIVSKKQESGRGRRGRAWATPEGNLAATLLLTMDGDLKRWQMHLMPWCPETASRSASTVRRPGVTVSS
jgi:BirA family biotin operon repressor/biotin-[acetyl-CoA-carboxylase] ligase